MKNAIFFLIAFLFAGFTTAQDTSYEEAMHSALEGLRAAESPEELQNAANSFGRIAQLAASEWLPHYYVAYAHTNLAWMSLQQDNQKAFDEHIDAAQEAIEQVQKLVPEQAEAYILEAYAYQALIMSQPMVNGPRYSHVAESLLSKAKSLDPDNPRAYYLHGQQWLNMPDFLGGGKEKALSQFEKAAEKFESYVPASELHPNWGAAQNAVMVNSLKG